MAEDDQLVPAWVYDLFEEEETGPLDLDLYRVAFLEFYPPNPQEYANPEHRDDVVADVRQEPQVKPSYASILSGKATSSAINVASKKTESSSSSSTFSGLATSSCSSINVASKKAESSSSARNGESSGTLEVLREHVTQNPMMNQQEQLQRAIASTGLSPNARPWSPPNPLQHRPMQTQMNVPRSAFVNHQQVSAMHQLNPNAPAPRMYQNYLNHQQVSAMHQPNLNAPAPTMYQQNQMGNFPSQGPMMQNYHFERPPLSPMYNQQQNFMRPETYQQGPYYHLPVANQSMPMMSPSGPYLVDQNYINQQLHQLTGFPIDMINQQAALGAPWYDANVRGRLLPRPRAQQPTQSQGSNTGPSSHQQGQDKNQQPRLCTNSLASSNQIPTNDQMMNLAAAADNPIRVYQIPTNDQTINHLLASTSSSIRVYVFRNQTPWRVFTMNLASSFSFETDEMQYRVTSDDETTNLDSTSSATASIRIRITRNQITTNDETMNLGLLSFETDRICISFTGNQIPLASPPLRILVPTNFAETQMLLLTDEEEEEEEVDDDDDDASVITQPPCDDVSSDQTMNQRQLSPYAEPWIPQITHEHFRSNQSVEQNLEAQENLYQPHQMGIFHIFYPIQAPLMYQHNQMQPRFNGGRGGYRGRGRGSGRRG
ncbi:hypothetical protein AALP_AA6G044300 [Arabis alpina]|uniref:Uncharacterized protein n=1 Tax=Arabis alpina TaxID=50452 RepID=A0A087GM27_ARAAL|nr:hypothetical protein AALP_AA6G044300 [Arabis alpina]